MSARNTKDRGVFRWEGEYWTIVFDRKTVRLRDSKGMRHLAALLRRPWEDVNAVDLYSAGRRSPTSARLGVSAEQARIAVTKAVKTALERIGTAHPTLGAHLGATVRRGYVCRYLPDRRHPIRWEG